MKKLKIMYLLIVLMLLVGCGTKPISNSEDKNIEVIISKNFGNEIIDKKKIIINDDLTVMDVMQDNFTIETAYGGGFINAIDDIKSGFTNSKERKKFDWFYYVNGISAEIGADDYYLEEGDQIIWDYHNWENAAGLNSIIGAYPRKFEMLTTEILYSDAFFNEAKKLSEKLNNCKFKVLNEEMLENTEVNSIVIAKNSELLNMKYFNKIYDNAKRIGLYFEINDDIKVLDYKRNIINEYEKGAVIVSLVKSYGEKGVLWIITGNDEKNIENAVNILIEKPEEIEGVFSALVINDEVIKLPIEIISED